MSTIKSFESRPVDSISYFTLIFSFPTIITKATQPPHIIITPAINIIIATIIITTILVRNIKVDIKKVVNWLAPSPELPTDATC